MLARFKVNNNNCWLQPEVVERCVKRVVLAITCSVSGAFLRCPEGDTLKDYSVVNKIFRF